MIKLRTHKRAAQMTSKCENIKIENNSQIRVATRRQEIGWLIDDRAHSCAGSAS